MKLNKEVWEVIYSGGKADVAGIIGENGKPIYQTMSKDGDLTGWRYDDNLAQAKQAADKDGK